MEYGDSVFARLTAVNYYGSSQSSDSGNGASILTVPDAPINLRDVPAITTAYVVGLEWEVGQATGGTDVLDYRILFD